ncbi:MAG: MliC family protein [Burkholderiaceae bacterium]
MAARRSAAWIKPALGLLSLAASVALAAPAQAASRGLASADPAFIYVCDGGPAFSIAFSAGGKAGLSFGGPRLELQVARSASGARYLGAGYEFWGKGQAATLTGPDGRGLSCRVARDPR